MIYFLDRNIEGRIFQETLVKAGVRVERHATHFDYKAKDEDWIPTVAERGWIIVSADKKIRKRDAEIAAIISSSAKMIRIPTASASVQFLANNFVRTLEKVEKFVQETPPPFIAVLRRPNDHDLAKGRTGIIEIRYPRNL